MTPPKTLPETIPEKKLTEIDKRALREAQERHALADATPLPTELGGRKGPEPTRFGDWEKKGIASDF